jgi:predicted phosphodiesterase
MALAQSRFSRRIDPIANAAASASNQLFPFAKTRGDGLMKLADLVGQAEVDAIEQTESIEFLATGDTGKGLNTAQSDVVDAMARDFQPSAPEKGATFVFHLGDVIYGPNKSSLYSNKFYRPNMAWLHPAPGIEGVILGIPGNHDGEVRDEKDNPSLKAFMENFCKEHTDGDGSLATSFNVKMPNQPGPYWRLSAPFLDLIGLYSNAAEDVGTLGADNHDTHQIDWLTNALKTIKQSRDQGKRNSLVIATHHPPYNRGLSDSGTGHPGSPEMLAQIDGACKNAGIWPDMFLSGHSHNYQRYMRTMPAATGNKVIPYLIAGTGGIGSQPVPHNIGNLDPTHTVRYTNALGSAGIHNPVYGYLRIHASKKLIQATFVQTLSDHRKEFETVAIDLASGSVTAPDFVN